MKNNKLIIHFKDYNIFPKPNEEIYISINYHELKDILDFDFILDDEYINENIFRIDPNKPKVVFTFDDGPATDTTPLLLDIFKNNKVHTSFFVLGYRLTGKEDILKRMVAEGHDIGNHTYSHKSLNKLKAPDIDFQINTTNELIKGITNYDVKYVRPPYGNANSRVQAIVQYPLILWNSDPRDWEIRDTQTIIDNVLNDLKEDTTTIVMHDIYQTTVDALEILLPELYVRGYQVLSISELNNITGRVLENGGKYKSY